MRAGVVVLAILIAGRIAAAQPNDAERLYTEGQTAYDDKRYDEAIAAWQRAYDLSHLPALVFNLAQAHRLKGECTKAVETYQTFIKLDPTSPQRADAEGLLKEIQPCADKPVEPKVVPETHVPPPPPNPGHGKRVAGIAAAGAGAVLVLAGAYFGSRAESLASDVKAACSTGHCEWTSDLAGKDADGRSDEKRQYILYGVGAAALVTSGVLYYLGSHEHAPAITVTPRPDGAAVTWSGSW
jgi:tetratricopeptide (TPR) repeat protein